MAKPVRRSDAVPHRVPKVSRREHLAQDGVPSTCQFFGSSLVHRQDQARFSCLLRDEGDVATLMRMLSHEA
jgi:hypothetical protein